MNKHFTFALASVLALGAFTFVRAQADMKMSGTNKPMPQTTIARGGSVPRAGKPLNVAFLVYDGVEALDLSGPLDVFVKANSLAPRSYNIYTVGIRSGAMPTQDGALTIQARYLLDNSPRPDILIIPGASQERVEQLARDPRVATWVKNNATASQTVMSVCTGAFLLGYLGLLDGKRSTTHWFALEHLQRQFPKTRAFEGVKFIQDGHIITTAGVASGIDGAFFLVEKTSGKQLADSVAGAIQYRRGAPAYPESVRSRVVLVTPSPATDNKRGNHPLASHTDPVCGMAVNPSTAYIAQYGDKTYGFCSSVCRDKFQAKPQKYPKATSLG